MAYKSKTGKTANEVSTEIQATITDKFLACLDKGVVPWKEQWNRTESGFLSSTGKGYSFMNALLLAMEGCTEGEFVTQNGIAERLGVSFKDAYKAIKVDANGQKFKGHYVYFYTMAPIYQKENGQVVYEKDSNGKPLLDAKGKKIPKIIGKYPLLKGFKVWQVGTEVDCPTKFEKKKIERNNNPIAAAEKIIVDYQAREGIKIEFSNVTPGYSESLDRVRIPQINSYNSSEAYYSDLFHELGHSTGHEKRLKRVLANRMERQSYSFEELVAEICSCSIMHDQGFDTPTCDEQSESYVKGWARALRSDKSMVEKACRMAFHAAKYIYTSEK